MNEKIHAGAWYLLIALSGIAITIGVPSIMAGAYMSIKLSGV